MKLWCGLSNGFVNRTLVWYGFVNRGMKLWCGLSNGFVNRGMV